MQQNKHRIIRNVTKPLASHNIQAMRPSNLESLKDTFQLEERSSSGKPYPGTMKNPVHYDGPIPTSPFWYKDPSQHSYFNPSTGSLLTKSASWPLSVATALGYDPPPQFQLEDPTWWDDMAWYANPTKNATYAPVNKTKIGQRYWDWDARYPSTYARYQTPWPNNDWNGIAWPAHLYGTLPRSWGELSTLTNKAQLSNLRIM